LILATILFALVAEELVSAINPTVESTGASQSLVGLTIVAIVTSAAEIANAILFAVYNNITLSIEIGSSVAIQICLIQMPALVFFSGIINKLLLSELVCSTSTATWPILQCYLDTKPISMIIRCRPQVNRNVATV